MSAEQSPAVNTCGCCQPDGSPTPLLIANRPGLSAIQYRVGTYGSFLLAMMEGIAHAPELRETWLTRSTDDFGIVVLAMWAYVGDILTFYQERIANEAYLRTAILQESIQRLAALLDYKPAPGSAAEADLAFFVEAGKQVQVPVGLRVQSVPGQNEKPQKFETIESVTAYGLLNQLQIFPHPQTYSPFAQGSAQAVLLSSTKGLAAGTKLAVFNPKRAERKTISGLSAHNTQEILGWSSAVQSSDFTVANAQVVVYDKEYHLFGSNTPSSFVQTTADSNAPGGVKFQLLNAPYANSHLAPLPANRFTLDARYDDLKPGATILIAQEGSSANPTDTFACLATVTNVATEPAIDGPLQSSVTWLTTNINAGPFASPITAAERARVTIYNVTSVLALSPFEYGDSISGGKVYVPISIISGLDTKRSIILDDAALNPQTVKVTAVQQIDTDGDGAPDHWEIAFTPDLSRTLSTSSATLYGNVANSSHGQTVSGEVLGNGDSSETFQSFQLQKSPVTFVHKAGAPHGAANTLQIQIGDVYWNEVEDLFGHGPKERVFTTSENANGMTVQFGDGVTGGRVPTGKANVVATYRQGIGLAGNVSTGALRTLLDRPVGLKSVSNPAAATGGSEPESLDQSRTNAPNTVRTFGRIVSLEDFEDSAREFAGVAKARSSWEWDGEERVVYLTVAGPNGAAIVGTTYDELVADLNSRRDPNRALRVRTYTPVPLQVQAAIFIDPDYVPDDVLAAVQATVESYFSFDNLQFGEPIHLSNVYAAIQNVPGVDGADMVTLQFKNPADAASHGASADPVQVHLRINDDELATLEDPLNDAVITVGEVQS